jgi:hypothetical protein
MTNEAADAMIGRHTLVPNLERGRGRKRSRERGRECRE